MRGLALPLAIALAVVAILSLGSGGTNRFTLDRWDSDSDSARYGELSLPTTLTAERADHLRVSLGSLGHEVTGVLRIVYDGSAPYISTLTAGAPRPSQTQCQTWSHSGEHSCRVVLSVASREATIASIGVTQGTTRITAVDFDPAIAKRTTSAAASDVLLGFLMLLAVGPLLYFLGRWPRTEAIILSALGLGWCTLASPESAVVNAGFAGAGYLGVRYVAEGSDRAKRGFRVVLASALLLLVFVKFVAPIAAAAFANPGGFALALPLGVSYLAIRLIDLLITARAGQLRNLDAHQYFAFMLLPHTLPAGPIFTFDRWLKSRLPSYSVVDFGAGAARVTVGITKKVVVDTWLLPEIIERRTIHLESTVFATGDFSVPMLLMTTLYVWLDFSAYCDIAIGAARAAGRRVPENFDWPLLRAGIQAYWRHWHMTLSNWVMRRVYFPAFLESRSIALSVFASMLTIGLWHDPTLSWTLWAVHHSVAMALEERFKPFRPRKEARIAKILRATAGVTFVWLWVSLGHAFTTFSSIEYALWTYASAITAPLFFLHGLLG